MSVYFSSTTTNIFENKRKTIFFLTLDSVGNDIFFLAFGHRTPPTTFKSLLKYMYSRWKEKQNYFCNPSNTIGLRLSLVMRNQGSADIMFCSNLFSRIPGFLKGNRTISEIPLILNTCLSTSF